MNLSKSLKGFEMTPDEVIDIIGDDQIVGIAEKAHDMLVLQKIKFAFREAYEECRLAYKEMSKEMSKEQRAGRQSLDTFADWIGLSRPQTAKYLAGQFSKVSVAQLMRRLRRIGRPIQAVYPHEEEIRKAVLSAIVSETLEARGLQSRLANDEVLIIDFLSKAWSMSWPATVQRRISDTVIEQEKLQVSPWVRAMIHNCHRTAMRWTRKKWLQHLKSCKSLRRQLGGGLRPIKNWPPIQDEYDVPTAAHCRSLWHELCSDDYDIYERLRAEVARSNSARVFFRNPQLEALGLGYLSLGEVTL